MIKKHYLFFSFIYIMLRDIDYIELYINQIPYLLINKSMQILILCVARNASDATACFLGLIVNAFA